MSDDNVYDLFGEASDEPENESDETTDTENEADPGVVAFMDQQSAEFNALEHQFADRYGFVHKCKCDEDYSSGNMVEVTECYANMTVDALEACATLYAENKLLRSLISAGISTALSEETDADDAEAPSGTETD